MKKEYNFKKMRRKPGPVEVASEQSLKTAISIRLNGGILAALKTEAYRLGIPYQTHICSVLHRYVHGELVDERAADLVKLIKKVS